MPETLQGRWGEREEMKRREGREGKGEEGGERGGGREKEKEILDKIQVKPETW